VALPAPSPAATALVTGASAGIGAAIAHELASRGHGVTLVARREERLRTLADELSHSHGVDTEVIACDLLEAEERDRLVDEVERTGRSVEILVNNAGFGSRGDFVTCDTDRQVDMVRILVETVVHLSGRFLAGMTSRRRGAVINVASTAAFQPMPGNATYAASKAFVLSFSEAVRTELAGTGVTVTAVCPGPVRTEFTDVAGMEGVEDRTPGVIWMSAEDVAREAVEGAASGKRVVVPGMLNRAGALAGQHSPRALALPIVKRLWSRA
jgi:short-subunit dehydrogenase